MDQQLLAESGRGDSLPDVPLSDVPVSEARQDVWVVEEYTRARVAEGACVRVRVGF